MIAPNTFFEMKTLVNYLDMKSLL